MLLAILFEFKLSVVFLGFGNFIYVSKALYIDSNLSKELNYNPISLAVAWVIYNQDILSPIISARNLKQLIPSLDSMKISITKEIYESINKITRTPPPATDRLEDVES